MKNIAAHIAKIERNLSSLSQHISKEVPEYIASAVYLGSSDTKDSIFALAHAGGDSAHQSRADRQIWRRKLSPELSAAAESYAEKKPSFLRSRMFPDEHICSHTPIIGVDGIYGILQTVFSAHAQLDTRSSSLIKINCSMIKNVRKSLHDLMTMTGDIDTDLHVRAPYAPDAVVMFCDISGFSTATPNADYRAQDFADQFCKDFILKTAEKHKAKPLRFEGDGAWLSFPFDPQSVTEKQNAIRNASDMARHITHHYGGFVNTTDQKFAGTHIKVIAEIGELRSVSWTNDESGPVFIQMTKNLPHIPRDQNSIMIGPELTQEMPDAVLLVKNSSAKFTQLRP